MIEIIARKLVAQPEAVSAKEVAGANATILELKVAKRHTGKVIGKEGRAANAVRTIVKAVSA